MGRSSKFKRAVGEAVQRFFSHEPIPAPWLVLYAIGAFQFALLSIPSAGLAILLVPCFAVSGATIAIGTWLRSGPIAALGLLALGVTAITRGFALWGIDQNGVGSNLIASFAWFWIAALSMLFALAVYYKGIRR